MVRCFWKAKAKLPVPCWMGLFEEKCRCADNRVCRWWGTAIHAVSVTECNVSKVQQMVKKNDKGKYHAPLTSSPVLLLSNQNEAQHQNQSMRDRNAWDTKQTFQKIHNRDRSKGGEWCRCPTLRWSTQPLEITGAGVYVMPPSSILSSPKKNSQ